MTKFFIISFLLLQTLLVAGQNMKTIVIDVGSAHALKLSEIAEKITPVVLEEPSGRTQNILLTKEYLFVASLRSVVQYDLSGKFIRNFDCGGYVTDNVANDTLKKELYVPVSDTIKCYDYSGKLKRAYAMKASSLSCFYHQGVLWVAASVFQPDKDTDYMINKINPSIGSITTIPLIIKDEPLRKETGDLVRIISPARISPYKGDPVVSFAFDNSIYKIGQNQTVPFVKWNINPSAQSFADRHSLLVNGFIGEYLCINYRRDDDFYIYLENMKTGKKFNAKNVVDDVFHTEGNCKIRSLDQEGYFYFLKENHEVKGDKIGNVRLKNGPIVFIVKIK